MDPGTIIQGIGLISNLFGGKSASKRAKKQTKLSAEQLQWARKMAGPIDWRNILSEEEQATLLGPQLTDVGTYREGALGTAQSNFGRRGMLDTSLAASTYSDIEDAYNTAYAKAKADRLRELFGMGLQERGQNIGAAQIGLGGAQGYQGLADRSWARANEMYKSAGASLQDLLKLFGPRTSGTELPAPVSFYGGG